MTRIRNYTSVLFLRFVSRQQLSHLTSIQRNLNIFHLDMADSLDGETTVDIEMLIGGDYYWDLTTGHTCRGDSRPVAIQTKLGWVLSGPTPTGVRDYCATSLMTVHNCDLTTQSWPISNLDNIVQWFWGLESLGINDLDQNVFT